jgi:hypothetical protein
LKGTDIVLVPQPSDDVNDPLNWPAWKKSLAFVSVISFASLTIWMIGGVGAAVLLFMKEFGTDLNRTVTDLISYAVLAIGFGVWL